MEQPDLGSISHGSHNEIRPLSELWSLRDPTLIRYISNT